MSLHLIRESSAPSAQLITPLDAGTGVCFRIEAQWPGAAEAECWQ